MISKAYAWGMFVVATIASLALGYLLALAGEPRNLWLFRDVLGLIQ